MKYYCYMEGKEIEIDEKDRPYCKGKEGNMICKNKDIHCHRCFDYSHYKPEYSFEDKLLELFNNSVDIKDTIWYDNNTTLYEAIIVLYKDIITKECYSED